MLVTIDVPTYPGRECLADFVFAPKVVRDTIDGVPVEAVNGRKGTVVQIDGHGAFLIPSLRHITSQLVAVLQSGAPATTDRRTEGGC